MLSAGGAFVGIFILKMAIKITCKYTPQDTITHIVC